MYNTTATITTKTIFSIYITVLDVKHYQNSKQPQEKASHTSVWKYNVKWGGKYTIGILTK